MAISFHQQVCLAWILMDCDHVLIQQLDQQHDFVLINCDCVSHHLPPTLIRSFFHSSVVLKECHRFFALEFKLGTQ